MPAMPRTAAERLLTEREASEMYGIPAVTLRTWRYRGDGPRYLKLAGKLIKYRVSDIETWLSSQVRDPKEGQSDAVGN